MGLWSYRGKHSSPVGITVHSADTVPVGTVII